MLALLHAPPTMRLKLTRRAADLARNIHGGIDYRRLLPLAKRRNAYYFIVRPGETNASLLKFFGRLRQGKAAIAELARFNRKKRLGRDGLFATLRTGEFILLPTSWVARKNAGARSLSGLNAPPDATPQMLGYGEDDMPPGDEGDSGDWTDWIPGDWSTPDPDESAPDGSGEDVDSVGNKFGVFCESGFHREWSFGWPPVECVSDKAGDTCSYTKDGVELDGWINRDGNCDNGIPKGTGGNVDPKSLKYEPAGPAFEPGIYPGYYDDDLPGNVWCGKGFAYYEKGFACAPYNNPKADEWYEKNGTKKGGGINTGGGGKPATGGAPATGGGGKPATGGGGKPATTPATKTLFQSLTDTTPKKIAIGVAVVLAIAAVTGGGKKRRR